MSDCAMGEELCERALLDTAANVMHHPRIYSAAYHNPHVRQPCIQ